MLAHAGPVAEGGKVVARLTMHGRHIRAFLGKKPTGKGFAAKQMHS